MAKIYTLSADGSIHSELESLLYLKENLEFQIESSQKELKVVNQSIDKFAKSEKQDGTSRTPIRTIASIVLLSTLLPFSIGCKTTGVEILPGTHTDNGIVVVQKKF